MLVKVFCLCMMLMNSIACASESLTEQIINHKYFQEAVFGVVIFLMIYLYFNGKSTNKRLVEQFLEINLEFFLKNFSYIGFRHTTTESILNNPAAIYSNPTIFEEETSNFFRIYFTGRENIKFTILNLNLLKRQDFLMSTFTSMVWPEKDKIFVEVAFDDEIVKKGILYATRTRNVKKMLEDCEDVKYFCKKYKAENLVTPNVVILGENSEIVEVVFDKVFTDIANRCGEFLESLEISDCVPNELTKGISAKICINLGKQTQDEFMRIGELIQGFLGVIDKISTYTPGKKTQEELAENRKKFAIIKEKKKKSEKDDPAAAREERYSKMTPVEKKKFEEKEARKAKAKSKMIKMVKS